jgi:hypothetical protein
MHLFWTNRSTRSSPGASLLSLSISQHSTISLIHLQLIRISDNPNLDMKNGKCRLHLTLRDTWQLGRKIGHLSVQTKLDTVSSNLHCYVQKQVQQLLSFLYVNKRIVYSQFLNKGSTVVFRYLFSSAVLKFPFICVLRSFHVFYSYRPPLWSSGQSSWLQIRRPGFDSRHYQKKK